MALAVRNLTIGIPEWAAFATIDHPRSEQATVSLIIAGSAADGESRLPRGTLTCLPRGCSERLTAGAFGCTRVQIDFEMAHAFSGLKQRTTLAGYAHVGENICRAFHRSDPAASIALRAAALNLVARALRELRRDVPPWLVAAREVIGAHFREPISPAGVAAAVGVAPLRLARAFRRVFGESVTGAIRTARVDAAVQELLESRAPARVIAARCGFHDASHLIRSVQASIGMTPASLRELRS